MTKPKVLRTPDTRFVGLPGFPFEPHYFELRPPTWQLAHALRGRGPEGRARCPDAARRADLVVPLSQDHPARDGCRVSRGGAGLHRFWPIRQAHGASQLHLSEPRRLDVQLVDQLALRRCTLLLQDWGGPIGLRLLAERPQCFDAVLLGNTLLPNCEPPPRGIEDWPGPIVGPWAQSTREAHDFDVGLVIRSVCVGTLDPAVVAAYDAPFPMRATRPACSSFRADSVARGQPRHCRESAHLAVPGEVHAAGRHGVQRRGSRHQGLGARLSRADPGRTRAAAYRDRERRAFHPGGRQRGAVERTAGSARRQYGTFPR